MPVRTCRV